MTRADAPTLRRIREAVHELARLAVKRKRMADTGRDDRGACDRSTNRFAAHLAAVTGAATPDEVLAVIAEIRAEHQAADGVLDELETQITTQSEADA